MKPTPYTPAQILSAKRQGMTVEKFVSGVDALKLSIERGKVK